MNTPEIIAAIATCKHTDVKAIRTALDARTAELKADLIAQAEDLDGRPKRKRRANAHKDVEPTK